MIYFDNNATTRPLPGVLDAMVPCLTNGFGNPSSRHPVGAEARRLLDGARGRVARFLGASQSEVYFTSGGTESIGLAFHCALHGNARGIVIGATEHSCVVDAANSWRKQGRGVRTVPVSPEGSLDLGTLERELRDGGCSFVSVIWVNNETGVVSPVRQIAEMCRAFGALCHVDGVQAPTKVAINLARLPIDYMSLSAHKFHGPRGCGVLFARTGAPLHPMLPGHQESGLRGGTENIPGIVGTAEALDLQQDWVDESARLAGLRDNLEAGVLRHVPGTEVNGAAADRCSNTTNIFFPGRSAADLVAALGRAGLCVSAGAACSLNGRPSHVILAMGFDEDRANSSIRFSLGRESSAKDVSQAVEIVSAAYRGTLATWGRS